MFDHEKFVEELTVNAFISVGEPKTGIDAGHVNVYDDVIVVAGRNMTPCPVA